MENGRVDVMENGVEQLAYCIGFALGVGLAALAIVLLWRGGALALP